MDFLVLDTETTALPSENGSIVEIAILEVRDWQVIDRLHFLVKPSTPMTPAAAMANGIKEKDLAKCPPFADIEPEVSAWLNIGLPIIAYNGDRFDKEIIRMEYERLRKVPPQSKWIDVYKIVYDKFTLNEVEEKTGARSRSQVNMAKFFGVSAAGAHRALADVEILLKIYQKIHEAPKPAAIVKKPDDFELKKNNALESLSKVKVEVVAVKAIQLAATLSGKVTEKLISYKDISVTDEDSNKQAAEALAWIAGYKKDATKARQDALADIKSVTSSIEEMFRDWVLKPLDRASDSLTNSRQTYITKQYEKRIEEANRKRIELERLAEEAAQQVFDRVKSEKTVDDAVIQSDIVYEEIMHEAKTVFADTKTEIKAGSSKVVDKIVFDVEIVDASSVPAQWLTPDIEAITIYVNENNGNVQIAGVAITPRAESKVRKR